MEQCPGAANIEAYCRVVRQESAMRAAAARAEGWQDLPPDAAASALTEAAALLAKETAQIAGPPPLAALREDIEAAISGSRCQVALPWPCISTDSRAMLPGTLTMFCGTPGASKSLAMLQSCIEWQRAGVPAAYLGLEGTPQYHLRRAMAQIGRCSDATSDSWVRTHKEQAQELFAQTKAELAEVEKMLYSIEGATVHGVLGWAAKVLKEGARAIVIDPVTIIGRSARPWEDDHRLAAEASGLASKYGASVIMVSHPRALPAGHSAPITLDDMAGGRAYQRFSENVIWLAAHKPKESPVSASMGTTTETHNRTMRVLKARNGEQGQSYALQFDRQSLCMIEIGPIQPD